ncbi:MAG TPA: phospholipid carrier-dependent glycosyltransferase, partial [Thermoanaerobaculia bacterium]
MTAGPATAEPLAGAAGLRPQLARRLGWAAVAWIALVDAALWWIYYRPAPKELFLDEWQYFWNSESLLLGQSGNPYLIWPPAQGELLAALRRALGDLAPAILAMQLWHTVLVLGVAVIAGDLARRVSGSRTVGAAAGLLFLAHPSMLAFSQYLFADSPYLAFLLLSVWLPVRFRGRPRASPWAAAAGGAAWGTSLLFKSAGAYAWPLWLLVLRPPAPLRPLRGWLPRLALHAALFLAVGMAVTLPARLDSWREHGEWVIADTSVFSLWVGVNEKWRSDVYLDENGIMLGEYLASAESPAERREIYRRKVRERVAERGLWAVFVEKVALQPYRLLSAKTNFVSQLPGPACRGHLPSYEEPRPSLV